MTHDLSTCGHKATDGTRCELPAGHKPRWFHSAGAWGWSSGDPRHDRRARQRRRDARELLQAARTTLDCSGRKLVGRGPVFLPGCGVVSGRWTADVDTRPWERAEVHAAAASALLDGLDAGDLP